MKEYQLEIFRKTAEIINENTRGCRNKEEEINKTFISLINEKSKDEKFKHEKIKVGDEIIFVEKINLGTKKYPRIIESVYISNVLKITEKTMLTPHKRVKLFDIIGKLEK